MDFVDSPEQAKFRAEARAWIARHAPHELYEVLKLASVGDAILESPEMIAASRAWQKKKAGRRLGVHSLASRIRWTRRYAYRAGDLAGRGGRLRSAGEDRHGGAGYVRAYAHRVGNGRAKAPLPA